MRLAPLFFLLPAFAGAQVVPSLGRTGPALPITDSVAALEARLGGPGGLFAAAQLALKDVEGLAVIVKAKVAPSPLRRLDVAYGLGLRDDGAAFLALGSMLGDPDESVAIQAEIGFDHAGRRAVPALLETALRGEVRSADAAAALLPDAVRERVARDPAAAGRAGAVNSLYGGVYGRDLRAIPFAVAALDDPRPAVRKAAVRRIVQGPPVSSAVQRVLRSPDPTVRIAAAEVSREREATPRPDILISLAKDPDANVRRAVAPVLASMIEEPNPDPRLIPTLARLVDDPYPEVADVMIDVLGTFASNNLGGSHGVPWDRQPPRTLAAFRRGLVRRLASSKRLNVAILLATTHDRRAYPVLAPLAATWRGESVDRSTVLLALGLSGDPRATPILLRIASETNEGPVALRALGLGHDPAAVAPLVRIVRSDPKGVGLSAAWALGSLGNRSATPALLAVARSLDLGYGSNYLAPLTQLGGPGVWEFALDVLERGPEAMAESAGRALIALNDPAALPALERLAAGSGRRADEARLVLSRLRHR